MNTDHWNESGVAHGSKKEGGVRMITLRGVVVPAAWDKKGNVLTTALSAHGEHEYIIDTGDDERSFLANLRKEVEIVGVVKEKGGEKVITVSGYRLIRPRRATIEGTA